MEPLKVQQFNMGVQTDEIIDVGRPKSTQTDIIETNEIKTQVELNDFQTDPGNSPADESSDNPTQATSSTSILQIPTFMNLRNQFYLPNLISGSLLAFAGNC